MERANATLLARPFRHRHPRRPSKSDQIESNHRAPIAGAPATRVANSKCGIRFIRRPPTSPFPTWIKTRPPRDVLIIPVRTIIIKWTCAERKTRRSFTIRATIKYIYRRANSSRARALPSEFISLVTCSPCPLFSSSFSPSVSCRDDNRVSDYRLPFLRRCPRDWINPGPTFRV